MNVFCNAKQAEIDKRCGDCLCPESSASTLNAVVRCEWTQDVDLPEVWLSDCGHDFMLNDGTPLNNDFKFCPFCGKELTEESYFYE